jgi:hypothetical protein
MTLLPTILLLGLATTFIIAGKGAFGGAVAMLGIPLLSLAIDPAPSLVT